MQPIIAICLAGFSFSFFPLMNAIGTQYADPVTFSVINHAATIFVSFILLFAFFKGPTHAIVVLKQFLILPHNVKLIALFSGIAVYLGGLFFILALKLMSKAGATMITEMWPALAIFITPIFIAKKWQRIRALDIWTLLLCLIGVVFITASETGQNFSNFIKQPFFLQQEYGFETYIGIFLAVLSAYCFAFSGVSRAHFANSLPQDFRDEHMDGGITIKEATFTYLLTYLLGVPLVVLLFFVMETGANLSPEAILPGVMNGVILTATSTLYSYAILKSNNANINILWYFAPLLASLWLVYFDFSIATDMIAIGGFLIVVANIVLIITADTKDTEMPTDYQSMRNEETFTKSKE